MYEEEGGRDWGRGRVVEEEEEVVARFSFPPRLLLGVTFNLMAYFWGVFLSFLLIFLFSLGGWVTNPVLSPVHFPKAEILPFQNFEFEFTLDQLVVGIRRTVEGV